MCRITFGRRRSFRTLESSSVPRFSSTTKIRTGNPPETTDAGRSFLKGRILLLRTALLRRECRAVTIVEAVIVGLSLSELHLILRRKTRRMIKPRRRGIGSKRQVHLIFEAQSSQFVRSGSFPDLGLVVMADSFCEMASVVKADCSWPHFIDAQTKQR